MRRRYPQSIALRIAVFYAVLASLWILFSDRLLGTLIADPLLESRLQTVKGWGFVAVTAVGLYILIDRGLATLQSSRAVARSAHSQLVTAVESLSKGLILWDEEDRLVICNSACHAMFSRLSAQLQPGAAFKDILSALCEHYGVQPQGDCTALGEARRHMDPQATYSQELRLNDGRWLELSERRIEGGGIIAIFTDISQGKRWEEAMLAMVTESQRRRPFSEATAEAVAVALDCCWVAVAVTCRIGVGASGSSDYPARLDLLAVWRDGAAVAPYSLDLGDTAFASLLDGGYHTAVGDISPFIADQPPDRSIASYAVMPFFGRRGRLVGYLLAIRTEPRIFNQDQRRFLDLMARWTGAEYERNRAVEALRESEQRFRLALQLDEMVVFLQDRDLHYTWIHNPHFGYPVEAVIGKSDSDLMLPQDAARLTRLKRHVIQTGQGLRDLVTIYNPKTRQIHYYTLILEPLREVGGEIAGVRGAAIDVTEEHHIKRDLDQARAKAERANQAKSRFLAAASHDMRQPLQAMRLFLDVLQARLHDQTLRQVADKASEALEAGTGLLNALLDVSSLEAGLVHPHKREVAVADLFEQMLVDCRPQAAAKGLRLRAMPSRTMVRSDPTLLGQILKNFLVNAIYYTEKGGIVLGCRHRGGQALLEVWDTGPGIADDQLEAVWEDFYQIGNPERDRRHGLGLGLAIVERMAKLLGHKVTVRSRPGKGSVFAVEVELSEAIGETEDAAAPTAGRLP